MGVVSCGTTMLDQGVFENIGAVTWDTTVKTSGFTAVSGNGYFCNTTSAAFTVTLPASPSAGDIVGIKDYANTAATNNITIGRNSSNIQGVAADFKISTTGGSVLLVYVDGTQGWKVTSASNAADLSSTQYIVATGGTITCSGDYRIHTFTGPGTFCVSNAGGPAGSENVDYVVVAGGGAGGSGQGGAGGGGAGGYRASYPSPAGTIPVSVQGYPITVGSGGSGVTPPSPVGSSGSNSVFSTITSAGGGGGAKQPNGNGASGGSGGGGSIDGGCGGAGNTPPVSPPQGNPGGAGPGDGTPITAGGGGGASAAGQNGTPSPAAGGAGSANSITGSSVTRAGGGGGSVSGGTGGAGGAGGGGAGGNGGSPGVAGTANTGGGSGGGSPTPGSTPSANGGSGVVIITYKYRN
jgi:hypothetical protein